MKTILVAMLALLSVPAWADTLTVTISAFTAVDPSSTTGARLGELCGVVSGSPAVGQGLAHVRVTSDPDSGSPGTYVVLTDTNGNFCTLVMTYTGQASADAFIAGSKAAQSSTVRARLVSHPIELVNGTR